MNLDKTLVFHVTQDFEALTPNLLARTIETVEGGGIVVLLLRTMNSLKQLYTMTMVSLSCATSPNTLGSLCLSDDQVVFGYFPSRTCTLDTEQRPIRMLWEGSMRGKCCSSFLSEGGKESYHT